MTLNLRKFNMQEIDDDIVVVMVGKRETGKSFLTRDLLYHHRDVPVGIAISGTEGANSFYSSIMPKLFIHEEYDTAIVTNLLKRQKKLAKVAYIYSTTRHILSYTTRNNIILKAKVSTCCFYHNIYHNTSILYIIVFVNE